MKVARGREHLPEETARQGLPHASIVHELEEVAGGADEGGVGVAAADEAQRQMALVDAARTRREKLALTAAQTTNLFADEQVREAAALRAEEQARKYQQTLDEAARRRARRAELAIARTGSVANEE